ncbi:MAG: tetratricopeptide repeat protein [Thermoguttaceae bacterium]|nr:tetratricopeptide repeat protein [Thermoguttaceae bacterium]
MGNRHGGPSPGPADRRDAPGPRPKETLPPARHDTELTGSSRRYDNLECQQIQARHAIRVPAGATIVEVDGRRLPIARPEVLAAAPAPYLFLPRGSHAVRFRPNDYPVPAAIQGDLIEEYESMRRFFGVGEKVKMAELVARAARTMDTHSAPFLVDFMGAHYAAAGQWDVAERKFRRALGINPAFVPAHLNLAECLLRRKARDEAVREVLLAESFNVENVFGLAGAIAATRQRLAMPPDAGGPIDLSAVSYVAGETPTEEDRRMTAILEGLSKYAVRDEDRAKILNNLAIHFAESGRPELALHHFHQSLAVVRQAGEGRFELARKVFGNIKTVCRKAGFAEADEYEQMETLVLR